MRASILRRAVVAGAIATSSMIGITAATPAHAQFGGIVYDPTNYAQNVLTAARSLQQVNNQIQQIQQQATSLINEARNLTSLPFSSLATLQQQVQRTQQLLGEAQRIAYDVQNVQQVFNGRYKGAALTGTNAQMVGGAAAARLGAGAVAGAVGGAARGAAFASGAASGAYALGSAGKTGGTAVAGGAAGIGKAAVGAAVSPLRNAAASLKDSYRSGGRAAVTATGGTISGGSPAPSPSPSPSPSGAPAWAAAMKRRQTMSHGATVAAHTLRSGDGGGGGASVDVSQKD